MKELTSYIIEKLKINKDSKSNINYPVDLLLCIRDSILETQDPKVFYKFISNYINIDNRTEINFIEHQRIDDRNVFSIKVEDEEMMQDLIAFLLVIYNINDIDKIKNLTSYFIKNIKEISSYIEDFHNLKEFKEKYNKIYDLYNTLSL